MSSGTCSTPGCGGQGSYGVTGKRKGGPWSKGLRDRAVVIRHAVKNALIPVVTRSSGLIGRAAAAQPLCGLQLPILVGGAVIMENIFNLPGIDRLMVVALEERDYPMVAGVNLFFASGVVLLNLFIDLIYPYLDPRIRYT